MSKDFIIEYKPLNNKQRKFLEYLRDEYGCLGWTTTIPTILQHNNIMNIRLMMCSMIGNCIKKAMLKNYVSDLIMMNASRQLNT